MVVVTNAGGGTTTGANKARLRPGEQWIGLENLILDDRFQPRAETNLKWSNILSDSLKSGGTLPPIDVFQLPDARLIVAAGFHRYTAARLAGETDIRCVVRDGTEEDAIVLAAGSNADADGKRKMSDADITKAVEMLLALDAWWGRSNRVIAVHVGCSAAKVQVIRGRISVRDGRSLPDLIESSDGKERCYSHRGEGVKIKKYKNHNKYWYRAICRGRDFCGPTPEAVREKVASFRAEQSKKLAVGGMRDLLVRNGFECLFPGSVKYVGLGGILVRGNLICVLCDFSESETLPASIGRLVAAQEFKGDPAARMAVACYSEDGPAKVIDLYRRKGFEFLTPEELAKSLKSAEPPTAEGDQS